MRMISNIERKLLLPVLLIIIFSGCSTVYYPSQKLIDDKKEACLKKDKPDENRQCQTLIANKLRFIDSLKKDDSLNNQNNFYLFAYKNCTDPNSSEKNCPFIEEKLFLDQFPKQNDENWPPKIGLALSGGGTRAASFHVGVLKALHKQKILKEVDVISSASGGSYAAYWYFSQNFYEDKVKEFFSDHKYDYDTENLFTIDQEEEEEEDKNQTNLDSPQNYRFQRALEEGSNILAYTRESAWHAKTKVAFVYGVETAIQALSIPINWITGGLFDWELNLMPYFYNYKDGLERTYGFVPLDYNLGAFANARPGMVYDNIDAEPILLSEMAKFLNEKKSKFPYLVDSILKCNT